MTEASQLQRLKATASLKDLAHLIHVQPKTLSYHVYFDKQKYSEFTIPKKNGGKRCISKPNKQLKFIQAKISKILYECVDEIHVKNHTQEYLSYGYRKGVSVYDNARVHRKKRYVFNIDLKDFFDAINPGRVEGFFIKDNNFELDSDVSKLIAKIVCYNNVLPQGSPSSPIISNLIGHILDIRLSKMARSYGCSYSRYCDDITFSTNQNTFPKALAYSNDAKRWLPSKVLVRTISRSGFEINMQKVRMSYSYSQQRVTGLSVNKKVNTTRVYRDTVRALVHSLCTKGEFEFRGSFNKDKIKNDSKLDSLQGMLNYIARIEYQELRSNPKIKRSYPNINELTKSEKTYKDYILFRYFFNPEKITIFGEGKTDKIHLKHYLKYREESEDLTKSLPINFSKWKDINFHSFESRVFDVISKSGGTGDIRKLINEYRNCCKKFYVSKDQNPVIILIDDDKGSEEILMKVEKVKKDKLSTVFRKDFYHIGYNLYLIFLPRINSTETDIENFYSKKIIDLPRKGVYFEKSNLSHNKPSYSKRIFATEIVPRNQELVDWSNFDPIFERIQLAVQDFKKR